jgi:HEPN domain-containing protein
MKGQSEEIKEWIDKADHDLGSAKIIYLHLPDYYDTIAFHCQQAVEKYNIAILIFYSIEFQRSHDLVYLLELLSRKIEIDEIKFRKAFTLNNFAVHIRYPNKMVKLRKDDLETAIQIADEFQLFSLDLVGLK